MNLTIKEALQKGIDAHRSGQLQEAEQFYTAILKVHFVEMCKIAHILL